MDLVKTTFVACCLGLVLMGCDQKPDPVAPPAYLPVQGTNLTKDYLARFGDANQPELPAELSQIGNYHFIFVRGIMGDFVTFLGRAFLNDFGQFQYFDDQMKWLDSVGVENDRLDLRTEASVEDNAEVIADAIHDSGKPVILVAHSEGCLSSVQALIEHPELDSKVAGVLALQGPFQGTPVADYILNNQPWSGIAFGVLTMLGGSGQSLVDLSTAERIPWAKNNRQGTEQVLSHVRFLSFGSWLDPDPSGKQNSMFQFSRDLVYKNMGLENDGLGPWVSSILPGSRYVAVPGIDHAATVSNNQFVQLDRPKFFKALLGVLFE